MTVNSSKNEYTPRGVGCRLATETKAVRVIRPNTLRREACDRCFIPLDAASGHALHDRLTALHPQRLLQDRIPPIGVLQPVCGRCDAQKLRAGLRPEVIRELD